MIKIATRSECGCVVNTKDGSLRSECCKHMIERTTKDQAHQYVSHARQPQRAILQENHVPYTVVQKNGHACSIMEVPCGCIFEMEDMEIWSWVSCSKHQNSDGLHVTCQWCPDCFYVYKIQSEMCEDYVTEWTAQLTGVHWCSKH